MSQVMGSILSEIHPFPLQSEWLTLIFSDSIFGRGAWKRLLHLLEDSSGQPGHPQEEALGQACLCLRGCLPVTGESLRYFPQLHILLKK